MKLRLNISPCPNDTFMFHAMIMNLIDCEGLEFEVEFKDIQKLNSLVCSQNVDISKVSYAIVPQITDRYKVLTSGGALGFGNGPLLVSRYKAYKDEVADMNIAIPGELTTANLLIEKLFPSTKSKTAYLFSDIAEVVASGEQDAGVLIHEGRFTYQKAGLSLIADLGQMWNEVSGLPLPLGAIVVSQQLDREQQLTVDRVLRRSIEYAFAYPEKSRTFVKQHARELSDSVIDSHIELFVNENSVEISESGREAVTKLLNINQDKVFVR